MPAASCSGLSATTICIVVQFGLATMPAVAVERLGVDLGHDERHVVVHAPRARVVDDDRAAPRRSAAPTRATSPPPAREEREVEALDRSRRRAAGRPARRSSSRPAERSEANGTTRAPGSRARSSSSQHVGAHGAGGADDATRSRSCRALARTPRTAARAGSCPSPDSSNAACSARTASARARRGSTHEILIGEVEIISMLIPSSPSVREHLRRDARMRLHSRADDRDLAHRLVGGDAPMPELGDERLERVARGAQVVARDRERHVGAARRRTPARSG